MPSRTVKNAIGFVILGAASLTLLTWADADNLNFVTAIAYVLLAFARMEFAQLEIYVFLAFGAIAGFFLGNLEALLYAAPVGIAYVLFAYLMSSNRERLATVVFVLSIPLLVVNSTLYPQVSTVSWGLVGLMVGIIENAVIEEMAEGDVFIIALYFMVLGPVAFIPLAFQTIVGFTVFEREVGHPVGPAMFVVAVPVFMLLSHLASLNSLPEWLFYGYYHGVTNGRLALLGAFLGTFGIPYLLADYRKYNPNPDVSFAGATMGAVAGLVTGLLSLVAIAVLGMYVQDLDYGNLGIILALLSFLVAILVGGGTWGRLFEAPLRG